MGEMMYGWYVGNMGGMGGMVSYGWYGVIWVVWTLYPLPPTYTHLDRPPDLSQAMMNKAGILNKPTVFMIDDTQVRTPP